MMAFFCNNGVKITPGDRGCNVERFSEIEKGLAGLKSSLVSKAGGEVALVSARCTALGDKRLNPPPASPEVCPGHHRSLFDVTFKRQFGQIVIDGIYL